MTRCGWLAALVLAWLVVCPAHAQDPVADEQAEPVALSVATKPFQPFVFRQNDVWVGFSIDLWRALALELGWEYDLYGTETVTALLAEVEEGRADFAVAGITITAEREETVDFSYAFFQSGLQIMVPMTSDTTAGEIIFSFVSPELLKLIAFLVGVLLIAAHIIWLVERHNNPAFPRGYFEGIWESFWWASVTMTTVGYGDKIPRARLGRALALVWMFSGIVLIAYFTASVTTVLTVQQLSGNIAGPEDLAGQEVATVEDTTAARWLEERGIKYVGYPNSQEMMLAVSRAEVDAAVYDAPALLYYANNEGRGNVRVVGPMFAEQAYGIAMPEDSPHREALNRALLTLQEDGTYGELYAKWFGR